MVVNMDFFDQKYYRFTKKLVSLVGQWPFQTKSSGRVFSSIYIFLFTIQFIPKVLAVIVHSNDISILLETVAPFAGNIISLVKFFNMMYRKEALTILLLRMERDWKTLINEDEMNILKEYAETGRKLVLAYTAGCYITVILYVSEPVIPKFQQILFGKNITPEEDFQFATPMEFILIDKEKYYWILITISSLCIASIITVIISSDTMFIVFLQHACALFAIIGHRLENFKNKETLPDNIKYYPPMEHKDTDMQRITKCVVSHNEAFKFAHLLEETYIWCFGIVVMMELPMLSVAAVMLMKPNNTIQQYIKHGTFVLAQLSHLFFDFYLSQKLMDHSARLQDLLFSGKWYNLSNKLKMLLLFIIMRSQVPLYLTAGKFLILSIENYGVFIKTSASYFTVILSTQ